MAIARINGLEYFFEEKGTGSTVVFAHGLTFDRHMWDPQVEALSARYRCLAFDFLGHGGSGAGAAEYTLEDEAENLHALMQRLSASPAHVVGLSMGGMVAMRLALAHPQAVRSLALLDTSAEAEMPERAPMYEAIAATAKAQGPQSVVDAVAAIMFSPGFIQSQPAQVEAFRRYFNGIDTGGVQAATRAVARRTDILDRITSIEAPTLVIVGEQDAGTTPDKSQHIAERIAGARLATVPAAGHMTPIEQPEQITRLLSDFLAGVESGRAA